MSVPVYSMPRPVDPHTGKECFGFQWIGQTFASCDNCGHPYWEHTHMEIVRGGRWFRYVIRAYNRAAAKARWGKE